MSAYAEERRAEKRAARQRWTLAAHPTATPELYGLQGAERAAETRRLLSQPAPEPDLFPADDPGYLTAATPAPDDIPAEEYAVDGPATSGSIARLPRPQRRRVKVAAEAPATIPPSGRPACPRGCGRSFRAKGAGLAWHIANHPHCATKEHAA